MMLMHDTDIDDLIALILMLYDTDISYIVRIIA